MGQHFEIYFPKWHTKIVTNFKPLLEVEVQHKKSKMAHLSKVQDLVAISCSGPVDHLIIKTCRPKEPFIY